LLIAGCNKNESMQEFANDKPPQQEKVSTTIKADAAPTAIKTMEYNSRLGVSPSTNALDLQWIADVI
jgi:hypothetical protein